MDNALVLLRETQASDSNCIYDSRVPDRFLLCPMGYGGKAIDMDPTEIPLIVALVFVTSALSGWFVGFALGPLAFMVIR